jgi:hypothetical protein
MTRGRTAPNFLGRDRTDYLLSGCGGEKHAEFLYDSEADPQPDARTFIAFGADAILLQADAVLLKPGKSGEERGCGMRGSCQKGTVNTSTMFVSGVRSASGVEACAGDKRDTSERT